MPSLSSRMLFGSSPRVRGTHQAALVHGGAGRFIPPCAGNTFMIISRGGAVAVHPRVCGEHLAICAGSPVTSGSSPRVRGTRHRQLSPIDKAGFIPACAGNTPIAHVRSAAGAVHPRVCGEHTQTPSASTASIGSSPRVRGTRETVGAHVLPRRFIPACAGNTRVGGGDGGGEPVHPRVCGEHSSWPVRCRPTCGSSPRVRGTLHQGL